MSSTAAEERVIEAALEWRRVYLRWAMRPQPSHDGRDLVENGENLALSDLLDALNALDEARVKP